MARRADTLCVAPGVVRLRRREVERSVLLERPLAAAVHRWHRLGRLKAARPAELLRAALGARARRGSRLLRRQHEARARRAWLDGKPTGANWDHSNHAYTFAPIDHLWLGWTDWHNDSANWEVYLDEVALDENRIGCDE
jgi:hypothetical protein